MGISPGVLFSFLDSFRIADAAVMGISHIDVGKQAGGGDRSRSNFRQDGKADAERIERTVVTYPQALFHRDRNRIHRHADGAEGDIGIG